jgi:hypothetical protein
MPISSLFSAVLRSEATIRWAGSNRTVRWRCCHFLAVDGQEGPDEASSNIADHVSWRGVGGALLGEFFFDGLDEFVEVEGFFEDAAGAEEFGHVEEVLIPLGAGHGDHLRVEIFPRQL